jgi:hypothetical protein
VTQTAVALGLREAEDDARQPRAQERFAEPVESAGIPCMSFARVSSATLTIVVSSTAMIRPSVATPATTGSTGHARRWGATRAGASCGPVELMPHIVFAVYPVRYDRSRRVTSWQTTSVCAASNIHCKDPGRALEFERYTAALDHEEYAAHIYSFRTARLRWIVLEA